MKIEEKYIKHQRNWRLLFATISTLLFLRVQYLRGEFPVPDEYSLLMKIFVYFIVCPLFIIIAWFSDNKYIYNDISSGFKHPISYQAYLRIGFLFLFSLWFFLL
ncbi:membrane hypothetical protein [Sulfurovum sp. enrichment culture clone C5]|uniref:Uncharacterized protein n=1 Tax=Sulfurovum sp. enrichment culture clone C5 TaxID=497650 RepID=A0A0S4XMF1_9BACT|nr:membrane hypothetical protein [Sulfurovum sp. enrichment culture clone C5]